MEHFVPFPPIEKHGAIGDRRSAALVAADGTIDWFCLPDYDDEVIFGALLDLRQGGFCRLGPERPTLGAQRYEGDNVTLVTTWTNAENKILLSDLMPWPGTHRNETEENRRVILRHLQVAKGEACVRFEMRPAETFKQKTTAERRNGGVRLTIGHRDVGVWTSFPVECQSDGVEAGIRLRQGEELWVMVGLEENPSDWSINRCRQLHQETNAYWQKWVDSIRPYSCHNEEIRRAAMTVHLLAHAPNDAVVAAVTTSLPERIGGNRNYDYRYTWVRDASLSAAFLANAGQSHEVAKYLDWLCHLDSETESPLQVCYRTDGQTELAEREVSGVQGYRDSRPVRFGNRAYRQTQSGSLGWLADCFLIYLESGGRWKPEFWRLVRRVAEYVCRIWNQPDNGIWELTVQADYVSSRVMAWVALDRAIRIARSIGESAPHSWERCRSEIHEQVLRRGWCEEKGYFRQRYDADAIDAGVLLIPLMTFLPPDDPRVLSTLEAVERYLVIDGFVHRFDASATLGGPQLPIGEFEGAFLPATFWFAHALARAGKEEKAFAVLRACQEVAGGPGIFAEAIDARDQRFLGNTPLVFSQVEYARALIALGECRAKHAPSAAEVL